MEKHFGQEGNANKKETLHSKEYIDANVQQRSNRVLHHIFEITYHFLRFFSQGLLYIVTQKK
jgi:hypothetical protein